MKRRDVITGISTAAIAWPHLAISQIVAPRRIGVLIAISEGEANVQRPLIAFRQVLEDLGWTEGRNVQIDYRYPLANQDLINSAAAELMALKPDVFLAQSTPEVRAVLARSQRVPIVCPLMTDPIGSGLVESFARPGGSVTGFTNFEEEMGGKWLGLLKEIAPQVTSVATILHPADEAPSAGVQRTLNAAASALGVEITVVRDLQIERALETFIYEAFLRKTDAGLIVFPGIYASTSRYLILALAAKYRLPAIYPLRDYVVGGGLMSYGPEPIEAFRQAASYVDRILRSAKPAQLPIQAPTSFRLVINLWAAQTLGASVPASLLARADEVIE